MNPLPIREHRAQRMIGNHLDGNLPGHGRQVIAHGINDNSVHTIGHDGAENPRPAATLEGHVVGVGLRPLQINN